MNNQENKKCDHPYIESNMCPEKCRDCGASGYDLLTNPMQDKVNKIEVTPEGRNGIYIPEKESLKAWIESKKLETIHKFVQTGMMMLGADHSIKSVFEDIDKAERLAIFTDSTANMGHSLALIFNNKLECYDIGKINEENLTTITKNK